MDIIYSKMSIQEVIHDEDFISKIKLLKLD